MCPRSLYTVVELFNQSKASANPISEANEHMLIRKLPSSLHKSEFSPSFRTFTKFQRLVQNLYTFTEKMQTVEEFFGEMYLEKGGERRTASRREVRGAC